MKLIPSLVALAALLIPCCALAQGKAEIFPVRASPLNWKLWRKSRKLRVAAELRSATVNLTQSSSRCELQVAVPKYTPTAMTFSWSRREQRL
jgi:hypothetical protein